jgi:hypothetical protein
MVAPANEPPGEVFVMGKCIAPPAERAAGRPGLAGHQHGIQWGWLAWPANDDPVWLLSCDGFEAKGLP